MGKGFPHLLVGSHPASRGQRLSLRVRHHRLTGVPGGTVYPALRRLEESGFLVSKWENQSISQSEPRPQRRYYELTRAGRDALAEAVKRYRCLSSRN